MSTSFLKKQKLTVKSDEMRVMDYQLRVKNPNIKIPAGRQMSLECQHPKMFDMILSFGFVLKFELWNLDFELF